MNPFTYHHGALHAEDTPLAAIAEEVGTPFYCYAQEALEERYRRLAAACAESGTKIAYAVKANGNLAVIATFARLGAGADIVSGGELQRALAAGVPADRIVFSGVGKTCDEIAMALDHGVGQLNVESVDELADISRVAASRDTKAPIALRVNPDVAAGGHDKISTGRKTDKFGVAFDGAADLYARAAADAHLEPRGLAIHIGSQIHDLSAFETAIDRLVVLRGQIRDAGHAVPHLDLGGGLGVAYDGGEDMPPAPYGGLLARVAAETGAELTIEPGRWLVAGAGLLVGQVLATKDAGDRRFVIVDAAMNDLIRPALYEASHPVWPVKKPPEKAATEVITLAGPVCESTDVLARDVALSGVETGDLVAIGMAGAYGAVLSSGYNGRRLVPEVMVRGRDFTVVRRRPTYEESMALDSLPDWMAGPDGAKRGVA
ncbi:MAG: diaminopimelate decarboxylase [Pseudomonadota bacterium]